MREGEMSQWHCNEEWTLEHAPLDECIPSLLSVSPWGKWSEWGGKTLESGTNWDTHTQLQSKKHRYQKCNGAEGKRHLKMGCTVTAAVKSSRWTAELRLCWLFHYTVPGISRVSVLWKQLCFQVTVGYEGWLIFTQHTGEFVLFIYVLFLSIIH